MYSEAQIEAAKGVMVTVNSDCYLWWTFALVRTYNISQIHTEKTTLSAYDIALIKGAMAYFMNYFFRIKFDDNKTQTDEFVSQILGCFKGLNDAVQRGDDLNNLAFVKEISRVYLQDSHLSSLFSQPGELTRAVMIQSYLVVNRMLDDFANASSLLGHTCVSVGPSTWLNLFITPAGAFVRHTKIAEIGKNKQDLQFLNSEFISKFGFATFNEPSTLSYYQSDLIMLGFEDVCDTQADFKTPRNPVYWVHSRQDAKIFWNQKSQIMKHDFFYNLFAVGMCRFKLEQIESEFYIFLNAMIKYFLSDIVWNGNKIRCIKITYYGGSNFIDDINDLILLLQVDGWNVFADAPGGPYLLSTGQLYSEFDMQVGFNSVVYDSPEYLSV